LGRVHRLVEAPIETRHVRSMVHRQVDATYAANTAQPFSCVALVATVWLDRIKGNRDGGAGEGSAPFTYCGARLSVTTLSRQASHRATIAAGLVAAIASVVIGLSGSGAFAQQVAPQPSPDTPISEPTEAVDPLAVEGVEAVDPVALGNAQTKLDAGVAAYQAGQAGQASVLLGEAYTQAPTGSEGDRIAMEAARRLGFIAIEARDPRGAEAAFAAETLLARRLLVGADLPVPRYTAAIGRWAAASGAMGRSGESAALGFYARELRRRQDAAVSSEILKRQATFDADTKTISEVNVGEHCVAGRDALLSQRINCAEEMNTRREALELQGRQIVADAPPPPTKAEREARAKERKAKGEQ
jgi:hypothetical protein